MSIPTIPSVDYDLEYDLDSDLYRGVRDFTSDFSNYQNKISYTIPLNDDLGEFEYRIAILPRREVNFLIHDHKREKNIRLLKEAISGHLLTEPEWRSIGLQMSPGWINYASFPPNPMALLFKRSIKQM